MALHCATTDIDEMHCTVRKIFAALSTMSRGTYPPILLFLLLLQDASVYLSFVLFQDLVKVAEIPTEMLGN